MARIVLATFGSLGDLHPIIALAFGLRTRGHSVAIATSEFYREKIVALGFRFHALRPDLSLADPRLVRRVMDGTRGSAFLMRDLVFPGVRAMYTDLAGLAADADLLVTNELVCAAPLVAATTGLRWVSYALAPVSLFSIYDPPLMPGPPGSRFIQSLGPGANRLFRAAAKVASYNWWKPVRILRRKLGLPPGHSPLFEGKYSPLLNLAMFSPLIQAPQLDWPSPTVQTGFLFHDDRAFSPALPPSEGRFLSAGEPPVVFTLGSSAVHLAGDFYRNSVAAARLVGCRALLLLGPNPSPPDLPDSILPCAYLPFAQIFPRAAAIVHQGGIGTTAEALRAGRPMLVVPFAHDQFDNAARVVRLGVARTLQRSRYRPRAVAGELAALLNDPHRTKTSSHLGASLRAERAIEIACAALEKVLS